VPVAEFRRQIAPGAAGPLEVEQRLQKLAIGHLAGRAGRGMFGRADGFFQGFPDLIVDDFPHGMFDHPKFQSPPRYFVHIIIREHALERAVNFFLRRGSYLMKTKVKQTWDDRLL